MHVFHDGDVVGVDLPWELRHFEEKRFPVKRQPTKQFFVFEVQKKTTNGNQTIIGKRTNDDGDIVYYMSVLLLPQYIAVCCFAWWRQFCLFIFWNFLLFVVIALSEHVASSRWSCQRFLITSAQDDVRCTSAFPCCAFAEPGDFWWFLVDGHTWLNLFAIV